MSKAKEGKKVKIRFTGRREDGTVFGFSEKDGSIEFVIGEGSIISGVEKAVVGMTVGDRKTITVPPEEGFGHKKKDLIKVVRKSDFPKKVTPKIGLKVQLKHRSGARIVAKVVDIKGDSVFLDGNHPLAGQTLMLDVELLEIMK